MAVGLGQVLELGLAADDRDRGVGQAGEIARQVAHVVQAVLDVPVVADQGRELLGTGLVGGQRGECIAHFDAGLSGLAGIAFAFDAAMLRILMNSNADSYPFRTLIPIFFERRLRSFLNSSERSNGAWNHHA